MLGRQLRLSAATWHDPIEVRVAGRHVVDQEAAAFADGARVGRIASAGLRIPYSVLRPTAWEVCDLSASGRCTEPIISPTRFTAHLSYCTIVDSSYRLRPYPSRLTHARAAMSSNISLFSTFSRYGLNNWPTQKIDQIAPSTATTMPGSNRPAAQPASAALSGQVNWAISRRTAKTRPLQLARRLRLPDRLRVRVHDRHHGFDNENHGCREVEPVRQPKHHLRHAGDDQRHDHAVDPPRLEPAPGRDEEAAHHPADRGHGAQQRQRGLVLEAEHAPACCQVELDQQRLDDPKRTAEQRLATAKVPSSHSSGRRCQIYSPPILMSAHTLFFTCPSAPTRSVRLGDGTNRKISVTAARKKGDRIDQDRQGRAVRKRSQAALSGPVSVPLRASAGRAMSVRRWPATGCPPAPTSSASCRWHAAGVPPSRASHRRCRTPRREMRSERPSAR